MAERELETAVKHIHEDVLVAHILSLAGLVGVAEHEAEALHLFVGSYIVICADVADGELPEILTYIHKLVFGIVVAPFRSVFP